MADEASALPPRYDSRSGCSSSASQEANDRRNETNQLETTGQSQMICSNLTMTIPDPVQTVTEMDNSDFSQITCGQRIQNDKLIPNKTNYDASQIPVCRTQSVFGAKNSTDFSKKAEKIHQDFTHF